MHPHSQISLNILLSHAASQPHLFPCLPPFYLSLLSSSVSSCLIFPHPFPLSSSLLPFPSPYLATCLSHSVFPSCLFSLFTCITVSLTFPLSLRPSYLPYTCHLSLYLLFYICLTFYLSSLIFSLCHLVSLCLPHILSAFLGFSLPNHFLRHPSLSLTLFSVPLPPFLPHPLFSRCPAKLLCSMVTDN